MKKYPHYTDFPIDEIMYGLGAPFVGIGIYTLDKKFSWPDREVTRESEYLAWENNLNKNGYDIPIEYKDAFVKEGEI